MDNPKMYSTSEIAKLVGLSESFFYKKRLRGQGPKYFKLGRKVFYRQSDVDVWLKSFVVEITPCGGVTGNDRFSNGITGW
jgi:predicted DNA-binding transcriptional regulator AlpA